MNRNYTTRIITSLILAPVTLIGMAVGGVVWPVLVVPVAVIGCLEFYALALKRDMHAQPIIGGVSAALIVLLLAAGEPAWVLLVMLVGLLLTLLVAYFRLGSPRRALGAVLITLAGWVYVAVPMGLLAALRGLPGGLLWLLLVLACTWGTDTMAYLGGKLYGRRKLAPRLSPKKTVEGALTGIAGGVLIALPFLIRAGALFPSLILMVVLACVVAIIGDLLESLLKRAFGVKDSHSTGFNIMPGHGGVLDRIDALLLVTTFIYFYLVFFTNFTA